MREDNLFDRCMGYIFLYGLAYMTISGMYNDYIHYQNTKDDVQVKRIYHDGIEELEIKLGNGDELHLVESLR